MAKIVHDTLQFRESLRYFFNEMAKAGPDVKSELLQRVQEIESRIGETTDIQILSKLDSSKKFYRKLAAFIDLQQSFIDYTSSTFESLEESYWNTIINGEKRIDEIRFLNDTITNMRKQRDIVTEAWKAERAKWNKERIVKMKVA
jgi:hypothetical protein